MQRQRSRCRQVEAVEAPHLSVGGILEVGDACSWFSGQPLGNSVGDAHCTVIEVALVKVQSGVPHSQHHALSLLPPDKSFSKHIK